MSLFKYNNIHYYSFLFFILYFVVQPIIQYEAFIGKIPDYLSFSLYVSIFLFILLLINYILNIKKTNYWIFDTYIYLILTIMIMYILIDYYIYSHEKILFERNLIVWLYTFMFYLFGKFFYYFENLKKYFLLSYVILVLDRLINLDKTGFQIITNYSEGNATNSTSLYLYMGDTFAILSLLLISITIDKRLKFLLIIISAIALYVTYSRTSFYVFLIVSLILVLKEYKISTKFLLFFLILILSSFLILNMKTADIKKVRMISFLITGKDASLSGRDKYFEKGLDAISKNILIGDYGGQYFDDRLGAYMHNILSYYRQFGIIVAIMFLLIFYHLIIHYYKWHKNNYTYKIDYLFYILLFLIIESLFARSYYTPLLFFALGMFSNRDKIRQL